MSWPVRSEMNRSSMLISGFFEVSVSGRAIAVNDRPHTDGLLNKWHQVLIVALIDLSNSDSPEALGLQHFNGNDNQHLRGVAFATSCKDWGLPARERKVCFINFNLSME